MQFKTKWIDMHKNKYTQLINSSFNIMYDAIQKYKILLNVNKIYHSNILLNNKPFQISIISNMYKQENKLPKIRLFGIFFKQDY